MVAAIGQVRRDVLDGGLIAGLIGYGTVVLVTAGLNVIAGRSPFHTAALFGSALFYGLTDPAALVVTPGPILAYNAAHLVTFLGLGLGASWLVTLGERHPAVIYLAVFLLMVVAFHLFVALGMFALPLLGATAFWHVGAGSVAAAGLMGWYLWRGHPLLQRRMREISLGDAPEEP